ncbi:protein DEHYDRATION-INDUCED 19 homolog 4 isoform X1 [Lactuca sativa]|uniref:protein DEHYDRATION-INDUCED 19 homolog 4 isoform X1 n=1 Tax=Lactuca sativa TaxID=4236 RepID=UPI000CD8D7EA|nr:protein DEHYDRATION-INDUCED 19 homolog 4 isoform X1 [Lactuca sativa]
MDTNSWTRFSTSNSSLRRYQSRSDAFHLVEETDDEPRPEYLCPFCAEDFDIVGLCCHIDEEHTVQAKNGVCPICAKKVGTGLVSHITMQHGSLLKVQRKRRLRRVGSNSTFSILKKELREGNLQSVLGGSSFLIPSSSMNTEPDPLLSSFIYNNTPDDDVSKDLSHSSTAAVSIVEGSNNDFLTRSEKQKGGIVSGEDKEEKIRRSEFVQGLVLSTFFNVDL